MEKNIQVAKADWKSSVFSLQRKVLSDVQTGTTSICYKLTAHSENYTIFTYLC